MGGGAGNEARRRWIPVPHRRQLRCLIGKHGGQGGAEDDGGRGGGCAGLRGGPSPAGTVREPLANIATFDALVIWIADRRGDAF